MSVSTAGAVHTFTTSASTVAQGEFEVTTTEQDDKVSFSFEITRNPLVMRVGSSSGDQDIVIDTIFLPGKWIISFVPGVTTYYVRFILNATGKATLENFQREPVGVLSLETPWVTDDQSFVRMHQSLNVVYCAEPRYRSQVIERRGETSWGIREFFPGDGPFRPLNSTDITLTPSARTGEVTITSSGPLFTTADVGALLRLTHAGQFQTESLTAVSDATDTIRVRGIESSRGFYYAISGTWSGTVVLERSVGDEISFETVQTFTSNTSGFFNDELDNQIIYYRLRCSAYSSGTISASLTYSQGVTEGTAKIISVDADNQVTADVVEPFSKTDATVLWYWGEWSDRFGWPSAVGMYGGRAWFGRFDQYWGSKADNFESLAVGPEDDDAISRTLTGKINAIRWLKGVEKLLVGTAGAEQIITAGELEGILTPAGVYSRQFDTKGSAPADACVVGDSVAFISRSLQRIYLLTEPQGDKYRVFDLTRLHPEVCGDGGFREIAFQQEPSPRLWCVRNDGQIAVLTFDPEEQIACWCRYTSPNASFKSVCVLPNTPEDDVYFSVYRSDIDTTLFEKLAAESFDTSNEAEGTYAWRLQCAVEYSGSSTTTLTGLDHLEGEDVYVWGNGRQSGPYTVSSGQITCNYAVTYAIIGKLYDGKWKSARHVSNTSLVDQKKIKGLGLIYENTAGGALKWGRDFSNMETLTDITPDTAMDSPVVLQSATKRKQFEGQSGEDPRVCILMPTAGPATVLALVPPIEENAR